MKVPERADETTAEGGDDALHPGGLRRTLVARVSDGDLRRLVADAERIPWSERPGSNELGEMAHELRSLTERIQELLERLVNLRAERD